MNKYNLSRLEIENRENQMLAPYAARSSETRGRVYAQDLHFLRTDFQRDRDRIVHSTAFRRLEYKTQVFIPFEETDHYRTRLTHTIEVAQISRTMARILCLNEDLAEAIALVHDLGHTPFGHSGEDVLNNLLKDHGGFNHNRQSLRVVDFLEHNYKEHPGLNLTYEVREGIVKHETNAKIEHPDFDKSSPTLEASLVDIADEIAYNSHDIDDGLSSGLITFEMLNQFTDFSKMLNDDFMNYSFDQFGRPRLVRLLIDKITTDVIQESLKRIEKNQIRNMVDVRDSKIKLISYSDEMNFHVNGLKKFLKSNLYRHEHINQMTEWGQAIVSSLFKYFIQDPKKLPDRFQKMLNNEKLEIVVADYIAGMTDRFAMQISDKMMI